MTSLVRPLAFLAIAAALILVGRCSVPHPQGPSADSTLAMAARDTVIRVDSSLYTANQTLQSALGQANRTIATIRARSVPPTPQPGSDDTPRVDSLFRRIAADSVVILTLVDTLSATRDNLQAVSDTLAAVRKKLPWVVETLTHSANAIGRLERRRSYPWAAGVLLEGTTPVGGFVSRDVWRVRVGVEVSDGPREPVTLRAAVGLRF